MVWPTTVTGWAALIGVVVTVLNVGGATGIWKLLVGPLYRRINEEAAKRKAQLNGYGERLTRAETTLVGQQQSMSQIELAHLRHEHNVQQCTIDQARLGTKMDSMEKRLDSSQQAILEAVHKVELQVATLAAKADVGREIAAGFEKIAAIMVQRDAVDRREERRDR